MLKDSPPARKGLMTSRPNHNVFDKLPACQVPLATLPGRKPPNKKRISSPPIQAPSQKYAQKEETQPTY
jgi:hypothetical protein